MASINEVDATKFSVSDIPDRYYYDCRPTDQLFDLLPFVAIDGHELKLNAIDTCADDDGLAQYANPETAGAAINSTMPSISTRTFALKRISAEMPVDSLLVNIYGTHRDLVQALINVKVNAVRDRFKKLLILGDTANAGEFDGLKKLVGVYSKETGANNGNVNGGAVLAGEMEELLTLVEPRMAGVPVHFVMHSKVYKHLVKNNYSDVEYAESKLLPALGAVPNIAGTPILIDDFIPINETKGTNNNTSSIYAVMLGQDIGLCGIYPSAAAGQPIQVRGPVVKEATDTMWFHVSWDCGLAIYNQGAVARLDGVDVTI